VLSTCAALGAVVLAETLDTSFRSAGELSAVTAIPVLARIPRIKTESDAAEHARRFRRGATAAVAGLVLMVGASYFVAHNNEPLVRMLDRGHK
jgi:hypothetical protein